MSEIEVLINEYNRVESEQQQRLSELYDLLSKRANFRRVAFSNAVVWVNCWQSPVQKPVMIAKLTNRVIDFAIGDDPK